MDINSRTHIRDLLLVYPEAREILSWYDVDLDDEDLKLDLGVLCACYELSFEDVHAELEALLGEDEYLPVSDDFEDEDELYFDD